MDNKQILVSALMTTIKVAVGIVIIFVLYRGAMTAYDYGYRIFAEGPVSTGEGKAVTVYIPEGSGVGDIGEILVTNGLIKDAKLFYLQNLVSAHRNELAAGVYELNTAMTAFEMMDVMAIKEESEE